MRSIQDQQRLWLANKLRTAPRGTRSALAKHLGVRPDAISRIVGDKETREIKLDDLIGMAAFFDEEPPGLAAMRREHNEAPLPTSRKSHKMTSVPLLDSVTAGRLRTPTSQIPVEDVPLLAFADLGRGEWFALTVQGDSMDRLSPDSSTIVVNRADRTLVTGKPYVISNRGETTYKLWRPEPPRFVPWSTNTIHEPIFVKSRKEAEAMVVGRVKRTLLDL